MGAAVIRPARALHAAVLVPLVVALGAMIACYSGLNAAVCYDVAWTAAAISATIGTVAARRRARPEHRARWTLWALATAAWLLGQVMWDVYGIVGFPRDPNLADVCWWGFALLVTVSMLRPPRSERAIQTLAAVESAPLICAAITLCLSLLWRTAAHSAASPGTKLSDLVYPCLYASATILTLQGMLGGALRGMRHPALPLVLGGTATISVAFMLWSSQLLRGTYVPGTSVLDPLWVVGLGAIALGALAAARRPESPPEHAEPGQMGVVLPAGMFGLLFVVLVVEAITGAAIRSEANVVLGLLCSGVALILRSTLLVRRTRQLLRRERAALARLVEREGELARLNEQLVEDSRHDPLLGIGNRRALSDDLPMYRALQRETGEQIAVLLCDVDHFKSYNDRFGHLAGDQALCMIAATARGALRTQDAAYRFGGEELLLILRGAGPEEASKVAERVRAAVQHTGFAHPDTEAGVLTVSVGLACGVEEPEELLGRADTALYEAKESGRNRVVAASDGAASGGAPGRVRIDEPEGPAPRHLRSMLAVSRAAGSGQGAMPVLRALADAIHGELSFNVVAVSLRESADLFRTVIVLGDPTARELLLDTTKRLAEWEHLVGCGQDVHGAAWLPAGSYDPDSQPLSWRPAAVAPLGAGGWDPDDMLLLPLRGGSGELLGFISVDQPLLGRRPTDAEIGVLMGVVDHAGLAVEQVQHGAARGEESDELRLAAVMLLAEALDLRDASTALHSQTVGRLARSTAVALGLAEAHVDRVHAAGVLHDLGKLGIADAILHKPGPLDDAEWREMRRHPEIGARILEHAGMKDIAVWVRAHHERIDGRGYPEELAGEGIPLEARILSVADSYEAMIADRPYRAGMDPETAREELERCAGTQFDSGVLAAFLRALDAAGDGENATDFPHRSPEPARPAAVMAQPA
jgi:diguanylate cyclase (GGDEF)-like protein